MKRTFFLFTCLWVLLAVHSQNVILVQKSDAQSLLDAVSRANEMNADANAPRMYILIPNGFYDFGEKVLTKITGHNISLIGQSTSGTIIRNCPDAKNEGISKTAVFQNRGSNNYFQDLTLRNALDYYSCGSAGRAVTLHDKGTRTICNRVCLMSFQDTYYSDYEQAQHYMKDTEIHGTVDFICGAGDVWFEGCRIVTEKRSSTGHGRDVIAAPRTENTDWGYVFNRCTIENIETPFQYARGWHTTPRCIMLNTTLLSPEKLETPRFDSMGMRTVQSYFKEYNTMDASGRNITPESNKVTFVLYNKEGEITEQNTVETIFTDEEAKAYTVGNVFKDWQPEEVIKQTEKLAKKLWKKQL